MGVGRRALLQGLAAAAAVPSYIEAIAQPSAQAATARRRILIKSGYVASLNKSIGDLPVGDVLTDGATIAAIGKDIQAPDAEVIDAESKLVLPGLIDTHRHTWETVTRSLISEGDLAVYLKLFFETLGPHYRPEDVYIGNLLGALGALSSGITTLLDWSHVMNTPAHADAAVQGLADSSIRGVFAYGSSRAPGKDAAMMRAADVRRVQKQYFPADDQLLTLAIAADDGLCCRRSAGGCRYRAARSEPHVGSAQLAFCRTSTQDVLSARRAFQQIADGRDKLLVFLTRRDVEPTNNARERTLRPSVIFRKVTSCFRSDWGAKAYADLCSVVATGKLNGLSPFAAIGAALTTRLMGATA